MVDLETAVEGRFFFDFLDLAILIGILIAIFSGIAIFLRVAFFILSEILCGITRSEFLEIIFLEVKEEPKWKEFPPRNEGNFLYLIDLLLVGIAKWIAS